MLYQLSYSRLCFGQMYENVRNQHSVRNDIWKPLTRFRLH